MVKVSNVVYNVFFVVFFHEKEINNFSHEIEIKKEIDFLMK